MTVAELNALDREHFVAAIGWVFEHSPWGAGSAWDARPFATLEALHRAMIASVDSATPGEPRALSRHPPALGALARGSHASTEEQAGTGLDRLSPEEFES